jgi:hypothetical protein
MPTPGFVPFVSTSLDGNRRILVTDYLGARQPPITPALEVSFEYILEVGESVGTLSILFGDSGENVTLVPFGLPPARTVDETVSSLCDAAIGDWLDKNDTSAVAPTNGVAHAIACSPELLEDWAARSRADERTVFDYMRWKAYAARYFEQDYAAFGRGDLIRLHVSMQRLRDVAERGQHRYWDTAFMSAGSDSLALRPLSGLAEMQGGAPEDRIPAPTQVHQYLIQNSQIGAVGANAQANNVSLAQRWEESTTINLPTLATELDQLRDRLRQNATEHAHFLALADVSSAAQAAHAGDKTQTLSYLAKSGKWVLDTATKVAVPIVTELLKNTMGLS